ncbi:phosphodiesterase [Rubrimonas cliftonensis]|uniref:3',5'-cyclic AMP phosphodiesterase CpdA n=1 Tax=Rubrimonas cliftonensis TaxID=89524 RepID=A0A1H4D6V5_9RHOB|nr:phosphodiesterase [Rubrimonas cliftonensis]SEA68391.1 3',5'-cyclic AMP phosphodiesterase CpdA [Rubrimonas cliftonensis]
MRATTIVQLTDTHLLAGGAKAYGAADTDAGLARAVGHIVDLDARLAGVDAVVVSGDLTDAGEPEAYGRFRELTAAIRAPIFVIPGNHDLRAPLRAAFGLAGDAAAPVDFAADVGALTLVGLDTSVPGAAHGAVSAAQVAWLDETLGGQPDRPALLFLHHPPFTTGLDFMDAIGLRDAEALEAAVRRHPRVRLVACGHVHRAMATVWAGRPAVIAPAPTHSARIDLRADAVASFDLDPGAVMVHRWRGDALVSHVSSTEPAPGPFPFYAE